MALLDAHSHDKDNGDITGTIEVTAAFVYARSPRLGPHSAQKSIGRAIALQGYAAGQPPFGRTVDELHPGRLLRLPFSSLANDDWVRSSEPTSCFCLS
jgi:hypothetical protein